jgi:hypothetical protein
MTAVVVVRAVFALLVLATVASRLSADPQLQYDMRAVVTSMLASQGFEPRLSPQGPGNALPSVDIDIARCGGTVKIMPLELTVPEWQWLSEAIDPKAAKRFVYLEGTWHDVDRIGMRLEWLRHRIPAMFGMGRYVTDSVALLLVGPPGCNLAEIVDWRMMWDRRALAQHRVPSG